MSAGENTVPQTVGGQEIQLRKLTPYDRAGVLRKLKAARRASLMQDLKDVAADKGEMLAELRDFDAQVMREVDFIQHVNTSDGQVDVLDIALGDVPEGQRAEIRNALVLSPGETLDLVARLCNLSVNPVVGEDDDPNARTPETATTPEPETYGTPSTATT